MIYGVTKEELHPSLVEYIRAIVGNGSGNNSLKFLKSNTTLASESRSVSIGISEFVKERDLLMVYKDNIYLENNINYTIGSDGRINIYGATSWAKGSVFNFVVILNVPELTEGYIINGQKLSSGSVSLDKLDDDLQDLIADIHRDIDGGTF